MSVPVVEKNSVDEKMITGRPSLEFTRFVIPSVIGLIFMQSATIVGGIFVGNYVGPTALAGVNLAFPMFSLFYGLCIMLLVGSAVTAGKALGEGNARQASNIFTKSVIAVTIFSLLVTSTVMLYAEHIAQFLGAQGDVLPLTTTYIRTIAPFMLFMAFTYTLTYFAKVDNAPNHALAGFCIVAVANISLDFLLIKVMGWGVVGAATATGTANVISCTYLLGRLVFSRSARIRFIMPYGSWKELIRAAYNGLSEFVNELSGGLVMFMINWILMLEIGSEGVAAFTIVNYTIWASIMVSYGIADALAPLVSVNFGARMPDRIRKFVQLSIISSSVFGLLIVTGLLLWPEAVAGAFVGNSGGRTVELTLAIIATIWPMFLFNGVSIILSGYFTGMHCARQSATIAISRSLVLPLVLMFVFWKLFGVMGAFFALPAAEIITAMLSVFMFTRAKPGMLIERGDHLPHLSPATV